MLKWFFVVLFLGNSVAFASDAVPLISWLNGVKREAQAQGVRVETVDAALQGFKPNETVIRLDRKQPEGTLSFAQYMDRVVTPQRIKQGRRLYRQHSSLLERIGKAYGVQPRFIVALWGIETNFGGNTGGFDIIPALATLAYEGRRAEFFRKELMNALQIVDAGHISLEDFQGSWAGAMGQSQFMPSSFLAYAQDYNGDGRKDIWKTLPDVFASIANYLKQAGWSDDETWGRKVRLPRGFKTELASREIKKPLEEWAAMGVRRADGSALPMRKGLMASIVYPGEVGEEAYLTYANYDRIMKWNRSTYFATAVGTLSDAIGR